MKNHACFATPWASAMKSTSEGSEGGAWQSWKKGLKKKNRMSHGDIQRYLECSMELRCGVVRMPKRWEIAWVYPDLSGGQELGIHQIRWMVVVPSATQALTGASRSWIPPEAQLCPRNKAWLTGVTNHRTPPSLRPIDMADWMPDCDTCKFHKLSESQIESCLYLFVVSKII